MNGFRVAALATAAAAVATLGYAVATGQLKVALVLIFPVFYGTGGVAAIGMLLLFAAFILWTIGAARDFQRAAPERVREPPQPPGPPEAEAPRRTRGGGVILLGPIPIVWGSDRGTAKTLMLIALGLMALWLAITLVARAAG